MTLNINYLILALALASSSTELFGDTKLGASFRANYISDEVTIQESGESEKSHVTSFNLERARLNLQSDLTNKTSFRLRLRFDKSSDIRGNGQTDAIDLAYVSHSFTPYIKLTIGKKHARYGGPIGAFKPYENNGYLHNTVRKLLRRTVGATLDYKIAKNHVLTVSYSNRPDVDKLDNDEFSETYSPKSYMSGLVYEGRFGPIRPSISLFHVPAMKKSYSDDDGVMVRKQEGADNYWGAGARYQQDGVMVGLSYLGARFAADRDLIAGTNSNKETYASIHLNSGYDVSDEFKLRFLVESTAIQEGDETKDIFAYAPVVEYRPDPDLETLRYFVSMKDKRTKQSTVEEHQLEFLLGFGLDATLNL